MAIPNEIQELWASLRNEVILLHIHWANYRSLYGKSSKRVDILNEAAGAFFANLHWILLDYVQLTLAKLGDRRQTRVRGEIKQNLVIKTMIREIKNRGDANLAADVRNADSLFGRSCALIRERRNTRIAHFDLETMMNERIGLATGPSREEIESALSALRNIMNLVERFYCDNETLYEFTVTEGDGNSMIAMLARGLRYSELVKAGTIPWEDTQGIAERMA